MSTEQTRKLEKVPRAGTLEEPLKPGPTFILPWRMHVNEDHLHKGLGDCGCGGAFCPDDDQRTT
jgi:hypothetical protein